MLNLSQRLILGCLLLAATTVGLLVAVRSALSAAGAWSLGVALAVCALLLCAATIYSVLQPIHRLATSSIAWIGSAAMRSGRLPAS